MWLKCDLEKKREGNTNRVKLFKVIFQIFCTVFAKPDTWLETPGFFRKKLRLWPALAWIGPSAAVQTCAFAEPPAQLGGK